MWDVTHNLAKTGATLTQDYPCEGMATVILSQLGEIWNRSSKETIRREAAQGGNGRIRDKPKTAGRQNWPNEKTVVSAPALWRDSTSQFY